MSRLRQLLLVALLLGSATARNLVRGAPAPAPAAPAPRLPASLPGEPGAALPLGPSEQVLAANPGVTLERRRYGSTQVALVSTTGIREVHPPAVCLRSLDLEVVQRREERLGRACVVHLKVRGPRGNLACFLHTYLDPRGGRCGFWSHTGAAALARLSGRARRWSSLQVMDRDPDHARRVLRALLQQLTEKEKSDD